MEGPPSWPRPPHLRPGGVAVGQTYPPGWDPAASLGQARRIGDAHVELVRAKVDGDRLEAEVRYGVDGQAWSQAFSARLLDESGLRGLLRANGLAFEDWLDRPGWFTARPA